MRSWELVVQKRLELGAERAVESVREKVEAELASTVAAAAGGIRSALRGGAYAAMDRAAGEVEGSHPLAGEVFVFMNPWGFIYPDGIGEGPQLRTETAEDLRRILEGRPVSRGGEAVHAGESPHVPANFLATVRREIASSPAANRARHFTSEGRRYCFGPVAEHGGLYVGIEVDPHAFAELLADALADASSGGFTVEADMPVAVEDGGDVVVTDSVLTGVAAERRPAPAAMFCRRSLPPPFESVSIAALLPDPEDVMQAGAMQARLYGWGIAVLALGIVVGVILVLRQGAGEIRQARARSDLVVGVSHDLRTPVASMKMLSESLYMGRVEDAEKRRKFLGIIVRETERLNQLIERVLFFVRFGQDAIAFSFIEVDLGDLVRNAVRAFEARSGAFGLADREDSRKKAQKAQKVGGSAAEGIRVSIGADVPPVRSDESAMTQVVLNLLDNAVKYGGGGGGAGDGGARGVAAAVRGEGVC